MKRSTNDYDYLTCECCGSSAPDVKSAKLAGWHVRDGVWMCDECFSGTPSNPHGSEEEEWIPDDGWC